MIGPEPVDAPVDERDAAGDVEAIELPATTAPDVDELPTNAVDGCLGDATERRALVALAVRKLHEGVFEPPRVDGNAFLLDLEAGGAQLPGDVRGGGSLLWCARHPEAARMRTERFEPLDDFPEVGGTDLERVGGVRHPRASSKPVSTARTKGPSVSRS